MGEKLTKLQGETLGLIEQGKVEMVNTGYASFRIWGGSSSAVGRLVAMGLARWPNGPVGEQTCEITPAGRAALSLSEGGK